MPAIHTFWGVPSFDWIFLLYSPKTFQKWLFARKFCDIKMTNHSQVSSLSIFFSSNDFYTTCICSVLLPLLITLNLTLLAFEISAFLSYVKWQGVKCHDKFAWHDLTRRDLQWWNLSCHAIWYQVILYRYVNLSWHFTPLHFKHVFNQKRLLLQINKSTTTSSSLLHSCSFQMQIWKVQYQETRKTLLHLTACKATLFFVLEPKRQVFHWIRDWPIN